MKKNNKLLPLETRFGVLLSTEWGAIGFFLDSQALMDKLKKAPKSWDLEETIFRTMLPKSIVMDEGDARGRRVKFEVERKEALASPWGLINGIEVKASKSFPFVWVDWAPYCVSAIQARMLALGWSKWLKKEGIESCDWTGKSLDVLQHRYHTTEAFEQVWLDSQLFYESKQLDVVTENGKLAPKIRSI